MAFLAQLLFVCSSEVLPWQSLGHGLGRRCGDVLSWQVTLGLRDTDVLQGERMREDAALKGGGSALGFFFFFNRAMKLFFTPQIFSEVKDGWDLWLSGISPVSLTEIGWIAGTELFRRVVINVGAPGTCQGEMLLMRQRSPR